MTFWPLFGPIFCENDLNTHPFEPAPSGIDREKNQTLFGENRVSLRQIKTLQQNRTAFLCPFYLIEVN